jgi:hypothetical protein
MSGQSPRTGRSRGRSPPGGSGCSRAWPQAHAPSPTTLTAEEGIFHQMKPAGTWLASPPH